MNQLTKFRSSIFFVAFLSLLLLATMFSTAGTLNVEASTSPCGGTGSTYIINFSSTNRNFTCDSEQTVYFGICDNGNIPNDDTFDIIFGGSLVASNYYVNGREFANIGSANASSGTNSFTLTSTNAGRQTDEATFRYVISPDADFVQNQLSNVCGTDFGGTQPPQNTGCYREVPVFTIDTAPSDGTVTFEVQYGTFNRREGWTLKTWSVKEGQRINNETVTMPVPHWARVWWQPAGETDSYLLTSQYWMGDGTTKSEYGLGCDMQEQGPSYHTSFSGAVHEDNVPSLAVNNG